MRHKCPKSGCTRQVPQTQLACRAHWYTLPQDLRSRLWAAYRARDTDPQRHKDAVIDCMAALNAEEATPA